MFDGLLDDLAPIDAYPTVDEIQEFARRLAKENPTRVLVRDVGASRAGDPIQLITIRADVPRQRVLVIGQPHPNEPIGMATIMTLSQRLLTAPAVPDVEWHFVACADPDGTRLNEGWFAGPFTREHYARNFYRPGGEAQVEWTYPFSAGDFSVNAPMPETVALMTAIDEVRPTVLASLHNGDFGGAYFYVNAGGAALYERLAALCDEQGIPLHLGDPEFPLATVFAPAIYSVPTAQQIYEFATAIGADPRDLITGANSLEYCRKYEDPVGVVVELPHWQDSRADDNSPDPLGRTRREIALAEQANHADSIAAITALSQAASVASPFAEAVQAFLQDGAVEVADEAVRTAETAESDRIATVAEVFTARENHQSHRLRMAGMLLRGLPEGSQARAEVERLLEQWCAEDVDVTTSEPIAIHKLVAVQAGSILAAVEFARDREETTP